MNRKGKLKPRLASVAATVVSFGSSDESTADERFAYYAHKVAKFIRKNRIPLWLFGAILFGLMIGIAMRLRARPYSKREVMYASFLGILLIRSLQCVTIPLLTTCVIVAVGRLDVKTSSRIGIKTVVYFLVTSFISSILGLFLVLVVRPGVIGGSGGTSATDLIWVRQTTITDSTLDIVRNLIPSNIFESCLFTHYTRLIRPGNNKTASGLPHMKWDFKVNQLIHKPNYVGLITVSIIIGFTIGCVKDNIESLTNFIESINDIFLKITTWIITISPFGIICLLIGQIIEVKDFDIAIHQLGIYTACCIVGLMTISLVIYPIIYSLFARKSPVNWLYESIPVATTAFATASSLAAMPTTLQCVEEVMHVDPRVSRFVVPLGALVNMNGAAFYNTVGPLYLAQLSNLHLNWLHYIGVCFAATLSSVGAAAIPQSAVVTMVMVMTVANVNPDLIAVVYTVDWLLDRFSTIVNVMGDMVGSVVVESLSVKELEQTPSYQRRSSISN